MSLAKFGQIWSQNRKCLQCFQGSWGLLGDHDRLYAESTEEGAQQRRELNCKFTVLAVPEALILTFTPLD